MEGANCERPPETADDDEASNMRSRKEKRACDEASKSVPLSCRRDEKRVRMGKLVAPGCRAPSGCRALPRGDDAQALSSRASGIALLARLRFGSLGRAFDLRFLFSRSRRSGFRLSRAPRFVITATLLGRLRFNPAALFRLAAKHFRLCGLGVPYPKQQPCKEVHQARPNRGAQFEPAAAPPLEGLFGVFLAYW